MTISLKGSKKTKQFGVKKKGIKALTPRHVQELIDEERFNDNILF